MNATETTRRQRRKEARPAELAAGGLALFVDKGFAAARLGGGGARAGVSKGTLYLYFDSKEALFRAVIEESVLPLIDAFEIKVEALGADPERLLRELLVEWGESFGSTPLGRTCKVLISEAGNFPEVAAYFNDVVIGRWTALLYRVIEAGMEQGVFRQGNPEALRQMVFYPLLMRSVWLHSMAGCVAGRAAPDTYFDTYFDVIFRGLLAAPSQENP